MSSAHDFVDAPSNGSVHGGDEPTRHRARRAAGPLTIQRLVDPMIESVGHHVASVYVERFWLPTIGPSSLWLLRHGAMHTDSGAYLVEADVLARSIGVNAFVLRRTMERLAGFGCAKAISDSSWQFRTHLAPVSQRKLERLPEVLRREHETWTSEA